MRVFIPMLAAGLAIGGAANAVTLTFSYTVAQTTVPFTSNFSLSSFDTTLGTLTGVEVILMDTSTAEVDIYNITGSPQSFTNASATVPLTVTGPGGATISDSVVAGPISGTAGLGLNTFTNVNGGNTESVSVGAGQFASYETATPQTVSFTASGAEGTYTGSGPSGVFFGGSATAGGTVEVQYTYTAAPEPAAWALMIVGFGMMGGVLRRRVGASTAI